MLQDPPGFKKLFLVIRQVQITGPSVATKFPPVQQEPEESLTNVGKAAEQVGSNTDGRRRTLKCASVMGGSGSVYIQVRVCV